LFENFDAVAAYLKYESLEPGRLAMIHDADPEANTSDAAPSKEPEARTDKAVIRGWRFFMAVCNECCRYAGGHTGMTKAPETLGYGSVGWIECMIADPAHESLCRSVGREPARMPAFKAKPSDGERGLIARLLHSSRELGLTTR
jgi:hypothetical protein